MFPAILGAVSVSAWLVLVFGRGSFWRVRGRGRRPGSVVRRGGQTTLLDGLPPIVAVIPARNEMETIGTAVESLFAQELSQVIVVDDGSDDGTADAAREGAEQNSLTIISGAPLPPGWTGKLWALAQGVAYAEQFQPEFLLLTDADIRHGRQSVAELAAIAEDGGYDLASYMVKLVCRTPAERLLIPAFVFFFFKLYPPAWVASPRSRTAGAAGGCMLIRMEALRRIGGLAAIRGEVIDDCALARAVKRSGGRVWLGLAPDAESLRPYYSFAEIGRMISRSAFYQLHHSALLLGATVLGLGMTYIAPPALALGGCNVAAGLGASAWLLMTASYLPVIRFYRLSPLWALTLPFAATFYMGATLHSAFAYWSGRGGAWKGRIQDARASG